MKTNEVANEIREMAKAFSHRHDCKIKCAAQKYSKNKGDKQMNLPCPTFRETLDDLRICEGWIYRLSDEDLPKDEQLAKQQMIMTCRRIVRNTQHIKYDRQGKK